VVWHTHIEELESGQEVIDVAAEWLQGRVRLLPEPWNLSLQDGVGYFLQF